MELLSRYRILKKTLVVLFVMTLIELMVVTFLMALDFKAKRSMRRFSVSRQAAAPVMGRSASDVSANAFIPSGKRRTESDD